VARSWNSYFRTLREQLKDFAAVAWANATAGWRKDRGSWPWPSAHDCWPGFVEMGWIAGQRIQTLLGPVQ
jgi:hypothetical protein